MFPDHKVISLDSNSLDVLILSLLIDLKGDILLIDIKSIEFEYGQKIAHFVHTCEFPMLNIQKLFMWMYKKKGVKLSA